MASDPGMHPGYVLLSNGQCRDGTIRLDLGMTAEFAAWWQHIKAADGEVITVGAITELPIPVDKLRSCTPCARCCPRRALLRWPIADGGRLRLVRPRSSLVSGSRVR